jgi:hypothetical protein
MPRVQGLAAHPSVQRLTDRELENRITDTKAAKEEVLQTCEPCEERDELIAGYDESIEAYKLALHWRGK